MWGTRDGSTRLSNPGFELEDGPASCQYGHVTCSGTHDPRHFGESRNLFNPRIDLADVFDEPNIQSLHDLATAMYAVARKLSELGKRGWALDGPPNDGVFHTVWGGSGDAPAGDANTLDGLTLPDALSQIPDEA